MRFRSRFECFPVQIAELAVGIHRLQADVGGAGIKMLPDPSAAMASALPQAKVASMNLSEPPFSKSDSSRPIRSQLFR